MIVVHLPVPRDLFSPGGDGPYIKTVVRFILKHGGSKLPPREAHAKRKEYDAAAASL